MRSGTPADLFSTAGSVLESPDPVEIDHRVYPVSQCIIFEDVATFPANKPIAILTDSASVATALQNNTPKHPWIQRILAGMAPNICFAWIPVHCGISDNIDADALTSVGHEGPHYKKKYKKCHRPELGMDLEQQKLTPIKED